MPVRSKGNSSQPFLQKGWEIADMEDDTLRSTLTYEGPWNLRMAVPQKHSLFPMGDPLVCFEVRQTRLGLDKFRTSCDFIGIRFDPTPAKIDFPGGTCTEPIETHERFTEFAGTPSSPNTQNGAYFDPTSGEFVNFTSGTKRGLRSYYAPHTVVNRSYWTWRVPQARRIAREIVGGLPGVVVPSSVRNFLLIGLPYRQVGSLFAVTETWLGSGPNGWDRDIYGR